MLLLNRDMQVLVLLQASKAAFMVTTVAVLCGHTSTTMQGTCRLLSYALTPGLAYTMPTAAPGANMASQL